MKGGTPYGNSKAASTITNFTGMVARGKGKFLGTQRKAPGFKAGKGAYGIYHAGRIKLIYRQRAV